MRTASDIDRELTHQLAMRVGIQSNCVTWQGHPVHPYAQALATALAMRDSGHAPGSLFYCEGWRIAQAGGRFNLAAHAWAELDSRIVDIDGANTAAAYFTSTRICLATLRDDTPQLPTHAHSTGAKHRHSQQLERALSYVLHQAEGWNTVELTATVLPKKARTRYRAR